MKNLSVTTEISFPVMARTYDELFTEAHRIADEFFEGKNYKLVADSRTTIGDMTGRVFSYEFNVTARGLEWERVE